MPPGEVSQRRAEKSREVAVTAEQPARDVECGRGGVAAAQDDRQQLRVGERVRALGEKPLTRAFAYRPVGDARHARRR
jgi:hypothetical protein